MTANMAEFWVLVQSQYTGLTDMRLKFDESKDWMNFNGLFNFTIPEEYLLNIFTTQFSRHS